MRPGETEWNRAEQMGYQSVAQAAKVGQMLIALKEITPYREFQTRVSEIGIQQRPSSRLMTLARHLPLLEEKRPDSQRAALAYPTTGFAVFTLHGALHIMARYFAGSRSHVRV